MTLETPSAPPIDHAVVPHEQWIQARVELLAREKELRRQMDEIAKQRPCTFLLAIAAILAFRRRLRLSA